MSAGAKNIYVSDTAVMHEIFGDSVRYIDPNQYDGVLNNDVANTEDSISRVLSKYSWEKSAKIMVTVINTIRG